MWIKIVILINMLVLLLIIGNANQTIIAMLIMITLIVLLTVIAMINLITMLASGIIESFNIDEITHVLEVMGLLLFEAFDCAIRSASSAWSDFVQERKYGRDSLHSYWHHCPDLRLSSAADRGPAAPARRDA